MYNRHFKTRKGPLFEHIFKLVMKPTNLQMLRHLREYLKYTEHLWKNEFLYYIALNYT